MKNGRMPKVDDIPIIRAALASHIEALKSFLSDVEPGDEVDSMQAELKEAQELLTQLRGA